jgi:hypothetical protein
MGYDPHDKFNTVNPAGQETPTETPNPEVSTTENNAAVPTDTTPTTPVTPQDAPKDEFIETFNKRFSTTYKADDEIKGLFELSKKIPQYEADLKTKGDLEKSVEQYKRDLSDLQRSESTKYLSSPMMQKAYIADQLQKKYPDKDPFILQEIAMSDVDKMGDLDAVAKERKIKYPTMKLENIKAVILNDLGIDVATNPEEWDSLAKDKLTMMAGDARENIKKLTQGIELPKVETQEERQTRIDAGLSKRTEIAAPFKAEYSKFDKFKMGEGLDYDVPKEFQEKLGDMFDEFVVKNGNEPTLENIEILNDLRDAFFFNEYKKEVYDAMYKDAETKIKTKLDEKLGNTEVPNAATASDGAGAEQGNLRDGKQHLKDLQGQRVTRI